MSHFDNRYPWIVKPDTVNVLGDDELRRFCKTIKNRTGCETGLDRRNGHLVFFRNNSPDNMCGLSMECVRQDGVAVVPDIEETVEIIKLGEMPLWMKKRELERIQARAKREEENRYREKAEERDKEARNRARYLIQRRGMGRHWRKSVTVKESN